MVGVESDAQATTNVLLLKMPQHPSMVVQESISSPTNQQMSRVNELTYIFDKTTSTNLAQDTVRIINVIHCACACHCYFLLDYFVHNTVCINSILVGSRYFIIIITNNTAYTLVFFKIYEIGNQG